MKYKVAAGLLAVNVMFTATAFANPVTTKEAIQANEEALKKEQQEVKNLDEQQEDLLAKVKESSDTLLDLQMQKIEQSSEIRQLQADIQNLAEKEEQTKENIEKRKEVLMGRAVALQEDDRSLLFMQIMLDSDSITGFLERLSLVKEIVDMDRGLLDQLKEDEAELKNVKSTRETQLKKLEEENKKLKETESLLVAEKERQQTLVTELEQKKKVKIDNIYQLQTTIAAQKEEIQKQEEQKKLQEAQVSSSGYASISLYNYDVRNLSDVTAAQINEMLAGTKLAGYGQTYYDVGHMVGIDPAFLASVSMAETGGTAVDERNNVGGLMKQGGGKMSFASIEECIEYMGYLFIRLYINDGLVTVEQIHTRYSPLGASNDPTNLNANWVRNVYKFMGKVGVAL
ncbi:MAG: coiled-coil domain-containing protein [Bacillus sp. (in: firmicutes)]